MALLGTLVIRYAAEGHHDVIRADKRVRDSLSTTARHAKRDEAVTKGWMQRHKTALLAIAGTIGAAMYTIARESPSMSAAIGEIRLAFSMFFMDVGERAAPFFEGLADLAWDLLEEWEKLPDSIKDALVRGMPAILADQLFLDLTAIVDASSAPGIRFRRSLGKYHCVELAHGRPGSRGEHVPPSAKSGRSSRRTRSDGGWTWCSGSSRASGTGLPPCTTT